MTNKERRVHVEIGGNKEPLVKRNLLNNKLDEFIDANPGENLAILSEIAVGEEFLMRRAVGDYDNEPANLEEKILRSFVSSSAELAVLRYKGFSETAQYRALDDRNKELSQALEESILKVSDIELGGALVLNKKEKKNKEVKKRRISGKDPVRLGFIDRWFAGEEYAAARMSRGLGIRASIGLASVSGLLASCIGVATESAPSVEKVAIEASFSGIIDRSKLDSLSSNDKDLVKNELDSIQDKYGELPGYVKGTEMSYWIVGEKDNSLQAYHMAGFDEGEGKIGVRVMEFCKDLSSGECIKINSPLLVQEDSEGNQYVRWIKESGEVMPVATYFMDGTKYVIDADGNIYQDKNAKDDKSFLEAIANVGVSPVSAQVEEATPTPTLTATEAPTETPEPSPTATARPTEVGYYFENWGNYPMTLDPEDVEKNGAIIPFNPVDNPIEFQREIDKMVVDLKHPSAGYIKDNGVDVSGYDPVLKRRSIYGELNRDFKIFFFQYKDVNYPFVITSQNGNGNEAVLIEDLWYGKFIDSNKQGNNVSFSIFEDHSEKMLNDFQDLGAISYDLAELIKISDLSWCYLKEL